MIKTLEIINNKNERTTIMLANPSPSGFLITNIDGLDAPKGTINMIERTRQDGSVYNGSRSNSRNIVITLEYFLDNTNKDSIEDLRHKTYRLFPVGENITLIFTSNERKVKFSGYVESNEVNLFSQKESSQISIMCEKAYGQGLDGTIDYFSGATPLFEFPFSNESLTEPLIEFGELYCVYSKMVDVQSEVKTGFIMTVEFKESVNGIIVSNLTNGQSMKINGLFGNGDILVVNTIVGQKACTLNGNNILGNFFTNTGNDWVTLLPRDNYITIRDGAGADTLENSLVNFEYPFLYMGV